MFERHCPHDFTFEERELMFERIERLMSKSGYDFETAARECGYFDESDDYEED